MMEGVEEVTPRDRGLNEGSAVATEGGTNGVLHGAGNPSGR